MPIFGKQEYLISQLSHLSQSIADKTDNKQTELSNNTMYF